MNIIEKWHQEGILLNYGRDIIREFVSKKDSLTKSVKVLDIGCGSGEDLLAVKKTLENEGKEVSCFGVDFNTNNNSLCNQKGIQTHVVNLEKEKLPFESNVYDISISNQLFEHLKNWTWAFQEQIRVTKNGGIAIVGMPNLAALHCRIQLLIGKQPSCIHIDDAHVRGFTASEFTKFVAGISGLKLLKIKGSNLYGVPPKLSKIITKIFPTSGVSIFFLLEKTEDEVHIVDQILKKNLETNYFLG